MDSPLLPTLKRNPNETASPTGLMANITLEPMSPSDSFSFHPQQQQQSSHSQSNHSQSVSSSSHSRIADADESVEGDSDAWDTPQPKKKTQPRFSLFAPQSTVPRPNALGGSLSNNAVQEAEEGDESVQDGEGVEEAGVQRASQRGESSAARDDKLRESLYELRQMNEVFDGFLDALEAARGHNERLASRVKQTTELLDQYTAILGQQEHTQSLVLNPKWSGAQDDTRALEKQEAEKAAAAEEAARQAESQRLAQQAARERATKDATRSSEATRGGARGRGSTRGQARGSGIPRSSVAPGARPATGLRKPSGGLGSQYANVKSSGYGPNARKAT